MRWNAFLIASWVAASSISAAAQPAAPARQPHERLDAAQMKLTEKFIRAVQGRGAADVTLQRSSYTVQDNRHSVGEAPFSRPLATRTLAEVRKMLSACSATDPRRDTGHANTIYLTWVCSEGDLKGETVYSGFRVSHEGITSIRFHLGIPPVVRISRQGERG